MSTWHHALDRHHYHRIAQFVRCLGSTILISDCQFALGLWDVRAFHAQRIPTEHTSTDMEPGEAATRDLACELAMAFVSGTFSKPANSGITVSRSGR